MRTGKTDQHQLSEAEILKYRIGLYENKERQGDKRESAHNPPNEESTASPSSALASLGTLTLQSTSTAGDTHAKSSAGSVRDCPAPAPPFTSPEASSSTSDPLIVGLLSTTSRHTRKVRNPQLSRSEASQPDDDGGNTMAEVLKRLDAMEKWMLDVERRLKAHP
ncbi:hypothetical protein BJV77DRAFT_1072932 [Russula vinacea]|nr:hypothetical protein BJV77DRAFT_1072932 [Russula vinacea]